MSALLLKLDAFLPYKLSIASNMVSDVIAGSYQRLFGLKVPEWRILAVIAESGGSTQLEIGQRTRMDKVTVSRAARAMQARGLVLRRPNEGDGRSHVLMLSLAGISLYGQVVPQALALEKMMLATISASQVGVLSDLLDRMTLAATSFLDMQDSMQ